MNWNSGTTKKIGFTTVSPNINHENNLERGLGSRTNLREWKKEVELTWTWMDLQTLAEGTDFSKWITNERPWLL